MLLMLMASIPLLANFKCKNRLGVSLESDEFTGLNKRQLAMSRMILFSLYSRDDGSKNDDCRHYLYSLFKEGKGIENNFVLMW